MVGQFLKQSDSGHGSNIAPQQTRAILADDRKDVPRRCHRLVRDRCHPVEKEIGPAFPIALRPHGVEPPIIFGTMTLEEQAAIERRRAEQAAMMELQRNKKADYASVAVEVELGGYELTM